jgi:hypothetical protein
MILRVFIPLSGDLSFIKSVHTPSLNHTSLRDGRSITGDWVLLAYPLSAVFTKVKVNVYCSMLLQLKGAYNTAMGTRDVTRAGPGEIYGFLATMERKYVIIRIEIDMLRSYKY